MEIVFDYSRQEDASAPREQERLGQLVACFQLFIGHELLNKFVPLQFYAQSLLQHHADALDEEARVMLDQVAALTQQTDRLVRRVAEIGRLLREPPWGPPLSLAGAIEEAVAAATVLGGRPGITYDVHGDLPSVHASRRLLHQVLVQLLRNAGQAMDDPSGVVAVGAERDTGGIRLWVRDDGRGLTESQISLFEPFAAGRFPGAAGPGLGLFLVCQAAALWRGALRVSSEVGQGSTFSLFIPDHEEKDEG